LVSHAEPSTDDGSFSAQKREREKMKKKDNIINSDDKITNEKTTKTTSVDSSLLDIPLDEDFERENKKELFRIVVKDESKQKLTTTALKLLKTKGDDDDDLESRRRENNNNNNTHNNFTAIDYSKPSALLTKLSMFLPQMEEANRQLRDKIEKDPLKTRREIEIDRDIVDEEDDDKNEEEGEEENDDGDDNDNDNDNGGGQRIEMSLGVGVVDLKTDQAVEEVEKIIRNSNNDNNNNNNIANGGDITSKENKSATMKQKAKIEVLN
jgi:hypothetical protein